MKRQIITLIKLIIPVMLGCTIAFSLFAPLRKPIWWPGERRRIEARDATITQEVAKLARAGLSFSDIKRQCNPQYYGDSHSYYGIGSLFGNADVCLETLAGIIPDVRKVLQAEQHEKAYAQLIRMQQEQQPRPFSPLPPPAPTERWVRELPPLRTPPPPSAPVQRWVEEPTRLQPQQPQTPSPPASPGEEWVEVEWPKTPGVPSSEEPQIPAEWEYPITQQELDEIFGKPAAY